MVVLPTLFQYNKKVCLSLYQHQNRYLWNYKEYFRPMHDTRIIPDFLFGATTVIFTITTLRMGYVGYQYATKHARDFDNHCDRIINVIEKNSNVSTGNTINIELNDCKHGMLIESQDHKKNERFKKELRNLLENKINHEKIKSYSIIEK